MPVWFGCDRCVYMQEWDRHVGELQAEVQAKSDQIQIKDRQIEELRRHLEVRRICIGGANFF